MAHAERESSGCNLRGRRRKTPGTVVRSGYRGPRAGHRCTSPAEKHPPAHPTPAAALASSAPRGSRRRSAGRSSGARIRAEPGSDEPGHSAELASRTRAAGCGTGASRGAGPATGPARRRDQPGCARHHHLPRQPHAQLLRRGARAPTGRGSSGVIRPPAACARPPPTRPAPHLVRGGLDRPAERDSAEERPARAPLRRLRLQLPLPARSHGTPAPGRPGHRRPRQGLRHVRPRRIPALLRRLARRPVPHRGPRPRAADCALVARRQHQRARPDLEQRLGRRGAGRRRLPHRGRRELLAARDPAEPRLRPAGQGPRAARRSC